MAKGKPTKPAVSKPAAMQAAQPAAASLQQVLDTAQTLRREQRWSEAVPLYRQLLQALPQSSGSPIRAAIHHNLSVCLLALGEQDDSLVHARSAFALDTRLWQSGVIEVNILKRLGQTAEYMDKALALFGSHPDQAEVAVAAANVTMNYLGDAAGARRLLMPFLQHPTQGREARTLTLMSRLYDRDADDTPQRISDDIRQFAANDLQLDAAELARAQTPALHLPARQGQRVGILSPMLSASPVHAFCFARLRQMHEQGTELIFIRRGRTEDWATAQFRSIATAWIEATDLEPAPLHLLLKHLQLDELYEMGGWMDVPGLRAVSVKPAPRMIKWVGGQSCTTGLTSFDGFVSDAEQSPPDTLSLYSEPLIIEASGYVTYTPPPYLERFKNTAQKGSGRWGVISNPVKLSRGFLQWLKVLGQTQSPSLPVFGSDALSPVDQLVLADQRYRDERVRQRVESVLRPVWGDRLQFEVPKGHMAFIETLSGLDGLIDTFPYSCGLTMTEALYVGLDVCFPDVPRKLFCERHGWAHVMNHHRRSKVQNPLAGS